MGLSRLGAQDIDVAVIGGSIAGLQAALTLGRACRSVLVLDDGTPRNAPAARVNNFLGQKGPSPAALLDEARTMLDGLDVTVRRDRAVAIEPLRAGAGFRVTGRDGAAGVARAVVLATGLVDELPDIPGVGELWGGDVVACPHCHGWEVRGEPLLQLGMRGRTQRGVDRALLLSRWSTDVVLATDGDEPTDEQHARLRAAGVTVRTAPVRRLTHQGGRLKEVEFADGTRLARRAAFTVTRQRPQSDLAQRLGCRHADGVVETDAAGRTSVPGVWAAGTATAPALLAIGAAGHAGSVALALHNDLLEQDIAAVGVS